MFTLELYSTICFTCAKQMSLVITEPKIILFNAKLMRSKPITTTLAGNERVKLE